MSNDEPTKKIDRNVWSFYQEDDTGKWRWRASDLGGKPLADSAESYENRSDAESCARRFGWNPDA